MYIIFFLVLGTFWDGNYMIPLIKEALFLDLSLVLIVLSKEYLKKMNKSFFFFVKNAIYVNVILTLNIYIYNLFYIMLNQL